ncbi:MAG: PhoH family protein [Cyanothece sp. SIO2G6]|nr:PhoH family protein [Cyanothece sp. SIO2G6]
MSYSQSIDLRSPENAIALTSDRQDSLKQLSQLTGATVVLRGQDLLVTGTEGAVSQCVALVYALEPYWSTGQSITGVEILTARHALDTRRPEALKELQNDVLARTRKGQMIRAKTFHQRKYIQSIRNHDLTFCIGPAGTGKTYLAAILGARSLLDEKFERLILTRPAVEAGEKLGFLPGDLQEKINPYLRPLYDALYELIDPDKVASLMEKGTIEIAPLAYMRGRTLSNSFIILDEAQNTTPAQMKMVLTRMGLNSCMVVTGDTTQTDLPSSQKSGLSVAQTILRHVEGIAFCKLTQADVVRHPLVQRIVQAYEDKGQ